MNEVSKLDQFALTQDDIQVLADAGIVPADTPVEQVEVFARFCREKGLSPFSGEVHLVGYPTRNGVVWARITGIDGFRKRAAMTGDSAGKDAPQFNVKNDGSYESLYDAKASKKYPVSCRVTVYRIVSGVRVPYVGEVLFEEYAGKRWDKASNQWVLNSNWKGKPFHMLAKCAEAMAYKAGFADQLSGFNIPEDRGAFENDGESIVLPEDEQEKRANEIALIKKNIKKMDLQSARQLYNANKKWKDDKTITKIFVDHFQKDAKE